MILSEKKDDVMKIIPLTSNQLEKMYIKMYEKQNNLIKVLGVDLENIDNELSYRIKSYNFILSEFYDLYEIT